MIFVPTANIRITPIKSQKERERERKIKRTNNKSLPQFYELDLLLELLGGKVEIEK